MEDDKENSQSPKMQCRKRSRKQQHQTRIGVHDSTNELQFYEVSVPVEETPIEGYLLEIKPDYLEGVYPLCPDMAGDNERSDFNLNKRQLKQLSKLKSQQRKKFDLGDEKLRPNERFEDFKRLNSYPIEVPSVDDLNVTKTEEEEILERAELYALTTLPDQRFYMLESQDSPLDLSSGQRDLTKELRFPSSCGLGNGLYGTTRKRKRRSYNNINCYVTHNNKRDSSDNTQMLPEGTRLIKPPNKLVELVAQVLDSSPDGLLQVQHIYTVLQNKYPYFRYMDKSSINSWRSSIRHALYQKWFKKVRFQTDAINSKGCFWAINRKYNPKEWTMPGNDLDEDCRLSLDDEESLDFDIDLEGEGEESLAAVASMLAECDPLLENDSDYGSEGQQDFNNTQPFEMISLDGRLSNGRHTNRRNSNGRQFSLPPTLRSDPDPVLAACTPSVDEPKLEIKSPQYSSGMDTPVLSFQDDHTCHMDGHCSHDWNMSTWEGEAYPHFSQLGYPQTPVYCWDYTAAPYPVCTEHSDSVTVDSMGYGFHAPAFVNIDDHWSS